MPSYPFFPLSVDLATCHARKTAREEEGRAPGARSLPAAHSPLWPQPLCFRPCSREHAFRCIPGPRFRSTAMTGLSMCGCDAVLGPDPAHRRALRTWEASAEASKGSGFILGACSPRRSPQTVPCTDRGGRTKGGTACPHLSHSFPARAVRGEEGYVLSLSSPGERRDST